MLPAGNRMGGFLLSVCAFLVVPVASLAGDVVCPVCSEVFSDDVEECPNDGTDLRLLGKPVLEKKEEAAEESPADDSGSGAGSDEDEGRAVRGKGKVGSGYRRLDEERRARGKKKKEKSGAYKDRRSRISTERRGRSSGAARRRKRELEEFSAEDDRRMAEYERRRAGAWEDRQQLEDVRKRAARDRVAASDRLLYGLGAPLTSIGFRMAWMAEGESAGPLSTVEIDLNLARYWFRAGLSSLIGIRTLEFRDELVFLEHISLGFQWPWRFSPYLVARGGVGILVSERFGSDLVDLISSAGVEVGIDCWLTPWIAVTPSFGYMRFIVSEAYWDSFTFKISVGF